MITESFVNICSFMLFSSSFLFFIYFVGFLFFAPLSHITSSASARFFYKLLLGFIFMTVLYAIYNTFFYTILSIVPVLYVIILGLNRKKIKIDFKIEMTHLILALSTLLFFIFIQLYRNDFFNGYIISLSQEDIGVYINVAHYLAETGVETSSPWYQLIDISSDGLAKPYHYGDLWLLSLFLKVSLFPSLDTVIYNYTPVLCTIATMGGYALWRTMIFNISNRLKIMGVLIALIAVVFNTSIPGVKWSNEFNHNLLMYFKIAPLSILLLGAMLLWQSGYRKVAMVVATLIPVFNIIYTPIIFPALGLFTLLKTLQTFKLSKQEIIYFVILFSLGLYIILFYKIFGVFQTSSVSAASKTGGYWFWLIKEFAAITIKYTIFNSLLIIISVILVQHRKQLILNSSTLDILSILGLLLSCSILSVSVFNNNAEAFQFTCSLITPINGLLFLILMTIFIQSYIPTNSRYIVIIIFIILAVYSLIASIYLFPQQENYATKTFITQADQSLARLSNPIGVAIISKASENSFTVDPRICLFCNFLKVLNKDDYWINSIVVPNNLRHLKYPERSQGIELSPFYRFIQRLKTTQTYYTYQDAQIQFINKYQVDFAVIEKGAVIPDDIACCATQTIVDSLTGHRLLLLKRPCVSSSF